MFVRVINTPLILLNWSIFFIYTHFIFIDTSLKNLQFETYLK